MSKKSKSKTKAKLSSTVDNVPKQNNLNKRKTQESSLLFTNVNFKWMIGGIALICLGMLLMLGGEMPDNNTWDESIIYSYRRTLLAPIIILIGLGLEFKAIFAK